MKSREEVHREELEYRLYVTDSLFYSAQNMRLPSRYADRIIEMYEVRRATDDRSADDIAMEIIRKNGLKMKKEV